MATNIQNNVGSRWRSPWSSRSIKEPVARSSGIFEYLPTSRCSSISFIKSSGSTWSWTTLSRRSYFLL
ncbi:predicted protein [Arabidopsis lyrata subsp. lyrata]|uniref:Predicted protein n=1 Tax=Arabidopsis lyrata subsp. lyrata TaxID=81972 RepID=D7MY45_ARALL|nr:predicted protein [Arabidopsis lyrata subsp. lyrata]